MDSSNDAEKISDLITLGELTAYETGVWQFPDKLECPLRSCHLKFDTRELAILHYTQLHAQHTALCKICNVPQFLLCGPHHMESHYKRVHPNATFPPKVREIRPKCSFCGRTYNGFFTLHKHLLVCTERPSTTNAADLLPETNHLGALSETGLMTAKTISKNTDKNSEKLGSWEDLDTDHSSTGKVSDGRRHKVVKRKPPKTKSSVDIRRLVMSKKKSRLSKPRHRAYTCTICYVNLKNYVIATNHYRLKHGRAISMCTFCKRYFTNSTIFVQHMMNVHPEAWNVIHKMKLLKAQSNAYNNESTVEIKGKQESDEGALLALTNGYVAPPKINEPEHEHPRNEHEQPVNEQVTEKETPPENGSPMIDDSENEDDFIILGENTKYPTKKWRFPNTNTCPKVYCNKYFESRHATMQHYYKMHAKNDLLCEECDTLISMTGQHNMINHFQRKHPNLPIPMPTSASVCNSETEMPKASTSSKTSTPTDIPNYIDHIIEQNEQITRPDADQSIEKAKKINLRREHMMRLNRMKQEKKFGKRREDMLRLNKMKQANNAAKLAATPKPWAEKLLKTYRRSKVTDFLEIELSQDDVDDIVGSNEKNVARKTLTSMQKHGNDTNKKKSSKVDAPTNAVQIVTKLPKSPPLPLPSAPSSPPKKPKQQQQQTVCSALNKRQRTRSTGVRHKACTICGFAMRSFVDACNHYFISHGRNVMVCPYCELYFLQSSLLTKHVLAEHVNENGSSEVRNEQKTMEMEADEDVDVPNDDNIGLDENHIECTKSTNGDASTASKSIEKIEIQFANDKAASSNTHHHDPIQINEEPLNLTTNSWDKPLDLSIKNPK